ncbi:MAG TPA: cell division protein SepF [Clostridiaceae bacterium]
MAVKVLNKMMEILGLEDEVDDYEEEEISEDREEKKSEPNSTFNKKQSKVVSLSSAFSAKVVIVKPTDYSEVTSICDNLKNRKIIVVNTTALEQKVAQRLLDFMGGASYALNGELSEIENGVYLLSPSTVEVSSELRSELSNKGLFSWSK